MYVSEVWSKLLLWKLIYKGANFFWLYVKFFLAHLFDYFISGQDFLRRYSANQLIIKFFFLYSIIKGAQIRIESFANKLFKILPFVLFYLVSALIKMRSHVINHFELIAFIARLKIWIGMRVHLFVNYKHILFYTGLYKEIAPAWKTVVAAVFNGLWRSHQLRR